LPIFVSKNGFRSASLKVGGNKSLLSKSIWRIIRSTKPQGDAAMKPKDLTSYSLKNISARLNSVNIQVNLQYQRLFPKPKEQLLSYYTYQNRWVKVFNNGYFNRARLVTSLIDFTFIRSLVADAYSKEGGNCYDPVSLFLCDIFRWLEGSPSLKGFCQLLHDKFNGHPYRVYAGISDTRIPCEADFSNFRLRIGEQRYKNIFAVLVELLKMLDLITASVLSHDGTLVPSFARYRGCNYGCPECANIRVSGDFISSTRARILKLLEEPSSISLGKEMRAYAKCPKGTLPGDVKPPSIPVCAFKLLPYNEDAANEKDQTSKLFGLEDELKKHNLMLVPLRTNISKVELNLKDNPVYVRCPRLAYDLDARAGYRRSKHNPDKKERVFGYQVIVSTAVEPETGLEVPISCITKPGNAKDGNYFIYLKEQLKWKHPYFKTAIDIGDCGFDETENYNYARSEGSIPLFDYNPRAENLTPEVLPKRGFNQDGWPYAPCGVLCRPNGYDSQDKRLSFVCAKQCLKRLVVNQGHPINNCPHLSQTVGFATHRAIAENPRLFCEIPRGTQRWKKIRNLRPASERTNSTLKSDLDILERPQVMSLERAAILAQLACISVCLKRLLDFIVRVTLTLRKAIATSSKKLWKELELKKIPDYLISTIQRK
jgi:hypothetical protein